MEAYKTVCSDCGYIDFWTGYKTGLGKTPEQLAEMQKKETICSNCGSKSVKTGLDYESETGKALDEGYKLLLRKLFGT